MAWKLQEFLGAGRPKAVSLWAKQAAGEVSTTQYRARIRHAILDHWWVADDARVDYGYAR